MSLLNKGVYNFLNNICEQPRYACYLENNIVVVYIQGGESIKFDPDKDEIILLPKYSAGLKIKKSSIDKDQLRKVYFKLTGKEVSINPDLELKKKYGIPANKRLTAKGRAEIAKYEANRKKSSGSKESPGV